MLAHENPFRVQRILQLTYRLQGDGWEQLLLRFEALGRRACILGQEGSGKTTLLESLAPRLAQKGYEPVLRLHHAETPRVDWAELRSLTARHVLLLDGADLLGWLSWCRLRALSRRWGGIIAASHTRRLLPVLYHCRTTPPLLGDLLRDLVPGAPLDALALEAESLFQEHEGNLRNALRACYDRCSANARPLC